MREEFQAQEAEFPPLVSQTPTPPAAAMRWTTAPLVARRCEPLPPPAAAAAAAVVVSSPLVASAQPFAPRPRMSSFEEDAGVAEYEAALRGEDAGECAAGEERRGGVSETAECAALRARLMFVPGVHSAAHDAATAADASVALRAFFEDAGCCGCGLLSIHQTPEVVFVRGSPVPRIQTYVLFASPEARDRAIAICATVNPSLGCTRADAVALPLNLLPSAEHSHRLDCDASEQRRTDEPRAASDERGEARAAVVLPPKVLETGYSFVVVDAVLRRLDMCHLAPIFRTNEIDDVALPLVSVADLRSAGVTIGAAHKIRIAARDFPQSDDRARAVKALVSTTHTSRGLACFFNTGL